MKVIIIIILRMPLTQQTSGYSPHFPTTRVFQSRGIRSNQTKEHLDCLLIEESWYRLLPGNVRTSFSVCVIVVMNWPSTLGIFLEDFYCFSCLKKLPFGRYVLLVTPPSLITYLSVFKPSYYLVDEKQPDYFAQGMLGSLVDQSVFSELMALKVQTPFN